MSSAKAAAPADAPEKIEAPKLFSFTKFIIALQFAVIAYLVAQQQQLLQAPSDNNAVASQPAQTSSSFTYAPVATSGLDIHGFSLLNEEPPVSLIRNFLTPEECEHLIDVASHQFKRSSVVEGNSLVEDNRRTSHSAFLLRDNDEIVKNIERRVASLTGYPAHHIESLQVVKYHPGEKYDAHFDYFSREFSDPAVQTSLANVGQRHITLFVYLNDLLARETGGTTYFPKLDLKVPPIKGSAVMWRNVRPEGTEDDRTLHGGEAPIISIKYGLNIWVREKPFRQPDPKPATAPAADVGAQ